jgi:hypothetical protein
MVYCSSAECTVDDCCNAKDKVALVQKLSFIGVRKIEIDSPLQRSIIEEAIAITLKVSKHLVQIVNISDTASRRLQHQWRDLLDTSVSITYIVRVNKEREDATRLKMEKHQSSHIINAISKASDKDPSAISLSAQSPPHRYTEIVTNELASDEIATNEGDYAQLENTAEFSAMMVAVGGGAVFIIALIGFILRRRKLRGRSNASQRERKSVMTWVSNPGSRIAVANRTQQTETKAFGRSNKGNVSKIPIGNSIGIEMT